jgi:hypothetical protein
MREQGVTARRRIRQIEPAGELLAGAADKVEGLRLHTCSSPTGAGAGPVARLWIVCDHVAALVDWALFHIA